MPKKRDIYNETEDFEEEEDVPSEQDTYPPESEEENEDGARNSRANSMMTGFMKTKMGIIFS